MSITLVTVLINIRDNWLLLLSLCVAWLNGLFVVCLFFDVWCPYQSFCICIANFVCIAKIACMTCFMEYLLETRVADSYTTIWYKHLMLSFVLAKLKGILFKKLMLA